MRCPLIIIVVIILGSACTTTPTPTPTPEPGPTWPAVQDCERPYSDDSIWNTPIDVSVAHPDSDRYMDRFWSASPTGDYVNTNEDTAKPVIYYVTSDSPRVRIELVNSWRVGAVEEAGVIRETIEIRRWDAAWLPLPADARVAPGGDRSVIMVETDTGWEYGLRGMRQQADGSWRALGAYTYHVGLDGVPWKGFEFRGADATMLAGLIRPCHIEQGVIDHALAIEYETPLSKQAAIGFNVQPWIPPFTDSDGPGTHRYDIPQGARIAIRPEYTIADFEQWCEVDACVITLISLQEYGGYLTDRSNRHPILRPLWGEVHDYPYTLRGMLAGVPQEAFYVVDWRRNGR